MSPLNQILSYLSCFKDAKTFTLLYYFSDLDHGWRIQGNDFGVKWLDVSWAFTVVRCVKEMIAKKCFTYGRFESYEYLLFFILYFVISVSSS